jgi:hypothetical protein
MEKKKISRSTKTKRKTPEAQARREMIKASAMKFASLKKKAVVEKAKPKKVVKPKKKPYKIKLVMRAKPTEDSFNA